MFSIVKKSPWTPPALGTEPGRYSVRNAFFRVRTRPSVQDSLHFCGSRLCTMGAMNDIDYCAFAVARFKEDMAASSTQALLGHIQRRAGAHLDEVKKAVERGDLAAASRQYEALLRVSTALDEVKSRLELALGDPVVLRDIEPLLYDVMGDLNTLMRTLPAVSLEKREP